MFYDGKLLIGKLSSPLLTLKLIWFHSVHYDVPGFACLDRYPPQQSSWFLARSAFFDHFFHSSFFFNGSNNFALFTGSGHLSKCSFCWRVTKYFSKIANYENLETVADLFTVFLLQPSLLTLHFLHFPLHTSRWLWNESPQLLSPSWWWWWWWWWHQMHAKTTTKHMHGIGIIVLYN